MSEKTREHLDNFWELLDGTLNVILFVLIGLEILVLPLYPLYAITGLAAIVVALLARWISVAGVIGILGLRRQILPGTVTILTWGGLHGGISVALALSLSRGPGRDIVVAMTYATVVFSIIVQGLTVGRITKRFAGESLDGLPAH